MNGFLRCEMAKMTFKAGDEYAIKLSRLATDSDAIAKKAIYEGAKIVADQVKQNLNGILSPEATGDLIESFGLAEMTKDANGDWSTKLGFEGYDRDGVPNLLKARVLESGRSGQSKRPFVRPAVTATKDKVIKKMDEVIDEEIKKMNL